MEYISHRVNNVNKFITALGVLKPRAVVSVRAMSLIPAAWKELTHSIIVELARNLYCS